MEEIIKEMTEEAAEETVILEGEQNEETIELRDTEKCSANISNKKKIAFAGMIVCVVVFIFGIISLSGAFYKEHYSADGTLDVTSYEYYGGDAYTGIQHASADASNNIATVALRIGSVGDILNNGFQLQSTLVGLCLISGGLIGFCSFAYKYAEEE